MSAPVPVTGHRLKAVSLFAGVGGMDLACQQAGIQVIATAEIDKHARAVLERRFPDTHHYDDVKKVSRDGLLRDVGALPDLVIGGFPCQDLSVAGLQAGLAGERSGLFFEHLRIAKECGARWVVFENVPGLLSSQGGRDMGVVLWSLAQCGYGFAYRVLDAQYFGVPQRRRRVFIVGCAGDDGSAPAEVLALAEGSLGHPAPSRKARPETAGAAGDSAPGALGVALRGRDGGATAELGTDQAHALRAAGGGGSAPYVLTHETASAITSKIRFGADDNTAPGHLVISAPDVAPCITAREGKGADSDATTTMIVSTPAVTYRKSKRAQTNQDDETWVEDTKTNTLNLFDTGDTRATSLVLEPTAYQQQGSNVGPMGTLRKGNGAVTGGVPFTADQGTVRRLTPMECERLQGFPDGWTEGQADSHRYRQMGNAVAVPCVAWITQRLVAVDAALSAEEAVA